MSKYKVLSLLAVLSLGLVACGPKSFAEGTYSGEAPGHNQEVPIKVEVQVDSEGKIKNITASHGDAEEIAGPCIDQLTKDMVDANTYKVDHIAGATMTSQGFKDAVKNALEGK